jgi:hypothetical protein
MVQTAADPPSGRSPAGKVGSPCIEQGAICKCKNERNRRLWFKAAKQELEEKGAIICDGSSGAPVYRKERDEFCRRPVQHGYL